MGVKWHKLGEFIESYDDRNTSTKFDVTSVRGVNISKAFMATAANLEGVDISRYKIVYPMCFVFSGMQTGRDECIRIAYNDGDVPFVISPAYFTFKIIKAGLIPEYLYMLFLKSEMDRLGWFLSDSSVRANLDWEPFLNIEIPVPGIEEQRKVVEVWQRLRKMKEENEKLAEPLMQLCRSYLQECKKKYEMVEIGGMIKRVDERNTNKSVKVVKSVSVTKEFKDTNAKVDKTQLQGYKIVKPGEISFVQTTGNEKCLCFAVSHFSEPIVVTSVNEVMRTDESKLLADYLYLWWVRKESDRYARFHSWGSARETFNWDDMCRVKIPLPPIDVQEAIVDVYRAANEAKKIAAEADRLSREICPALIQRVIKEAV